MPIPQKRNQNTEKVQFQVREFQYFFCSFTNKDKEKRRKGFV
jgi:hypothetical protein